MLLVYLEKSYVRLMMIFKLFITPDFTIAQKHQLFKIQKCSSHLF